MHRLAELSDERRNRLGWLLILTGSVVLVVGGLVDPLFEPRPHHSDRWTNRSAGRRLLQLGPAWVVLEGTRLSGRIRCLADDVARSGDGLRHRAADDLGAGGVLRFLTWIELVVIFGIVPSEWLSLSQTDLDWSPQKIFVTIPSWLVLGNEVAISYAALKDIISGGYHVTVSGVRSSFAYKIQDFGKPRKVEQINRRWSRHMAVLW